MSKSNSERKDLAARSCLEFVRRQMFTEKPVCDSSDYFYRGLSVSSDFRNKHYFGLRALMRATDGTGVVDARDAFEFERLIGDAVEQEDRKSFPDFLSSGFGFIEHFAVTASAEDSHGSEEKKRDSKLMRRFENEKSKVETEIKKTFDGHPQLRRFSVCDSLFIQSRDCLLRSFVHHWNHHIDSLYKVISDGVFGPDDVGAFLIDMQHCSLLMHESICDGVDVEGMYPAAFDKLREYSGPYSLVHDAKLLRYMYYYRHLVKYVIFVGLSGIEVIKLDSIPALIHFLPYPFFYAGPVGFQQSSGYVVSVPRSPLGEQGATIIERKHEE